MSEYVLCFCFFLVPIHIKIREIRECKVFKVLLALVPGLQACLVDEDNTSNEDVLNISGMVSRLHDVLSWPSDSTASCRKVPIAPDPTIQKVSRVLLLTGSRCRISLWYPLCSATKKPTMDSIMTPRVCSFVLLALIGRILSKCTLIDCCKNLTMPTRIRDKLQNSTYLVPADQWPIFMWKDYKYDEGDPWKGLLRSKILVKVKCSATFSIGSDWSNNFQAFRHVFTSPSSVDRVPKATRQGNAKLHNMNQVNTASLAYIATQVYRFPTTGTPPTNIHRSDLPYRRPRSLHKVIPNLIQYGSTIAYLHFWRIPTKKRRSKNCLHFGIGMPLDPLDAHQDTNHNLSIGSFSRAIPCPKHPSRRTVPCRGSSNVGRNAANYIQ